MIFWIGIILLAIAYGFITETVNKIKYLKDFYDLSDDEVAQIRLCNEWTGWNWFMMIGGYVLFIVGAVCEILGMIFWSF